MKRIVLASVATLALVVGLVAVGLLVLDDDRDGRWGRPGGRAAGPAMMSGTQHHGADGHGHGSVRGEADYLVEMVAHHEDAIVAAAELSRSERPRMRGLGTSIVESQTAQVEQMTAWLDEWYPEAAEADYEPMMSDLSDLSGDRLDQVFLQEMVGHHMMAVMSSQQLLFRGLADHDEVADLARVIRTDQRAEIGTMVRWLRVWFGTGPTAGMMGMTR